MDNGYNITAEEQALIQSEFAALINDYLNSNHRRKVDIINKAFALANEAHKGVRRRSGEPYILHPIAVARIISKEIGLGSTSICAALLHDVVEDTDYTVDDLRSMFGDKIAAIVDGVTKIPSGMFGDNVSSQAENFRKLLLTMSDDIRVILVKIADRLHNMRTLGSMLPAKRYKIAGETMYIYAPLAHRLGLFAIKTELEELSFKYENPDAYNHIIHKLEESNIHRSRIYENFATPVVERLNRLNISYDMKAREKSIYSIWNKMQKKNVAFEEIYDLFAVRIIFDAPEAEEKARCWDIYTAITELYELRPTLFRLRRQGNQSCFGSRQIALQSSGRYFPFLFDNGNLFGNVFQLADVTRPTIFGEYPFGRFAKGDNGHSVTLGKIAGKFAKQQINILLTLSQGRYGDGYHIQTVVQIFAEASFTDSLHHIHVGSGHHSHIGFFHFGRPYFDKLFGFQHTQ